MTKRLLLPLLPAAASLAFAAPAAAASTPVTTSENWAGYEATAPSSSGFQAVSGSWREPTVSCDNGQTYSAYWVGLGGSGDGNGTLEQVGTQADCSASGQVSDYAWYELVPSAPVRLDLAIKPGDEIYARTAVSGDQVTVELSDRSTGHSTTKTLTLANPDTSTAEWIAEAPSACEGGTQGACQVLPLSDFGTVDFSDAYAKAADTVGSAGNWSAQSIALATDSAGATPGSLSSGGTRFTVAYDTQSAQSSSEYSSSGYGSDGGYPGGGYGSSGYGPYGGGYGSSGYGPYGGGYGYPGAGDSAGYTNSSSTGYTGYVYVYPAWGY